MKPRLATELRQDASALAAEVNRLRNALEQIAAWSCENRQLVALSALGWLENQ